MAQTSHSLPRGYQAGERLEQPVLAAATAGQPWAAVSLYSPTVLRVGARWHMWFVGSSGPTRVADHSLGHAESVDGRHWVPDPANPVLTPADLPFGKNWQTPCVRYDEARHLFQMWFVTTTFYSCEYRADGSPSCTGMDQALGYAESPDGRQWRVHPQPLYPSGRGPTVHRLHDGSYVMWLCSRPSPAHAWDELYQNIYRFTSPDGLHWERAASPCIRPSGVIKSCVYPSVMADGEGWLMLHGGHTAGGTFQLFQARSADGVSWQADHEHPVLPPGPAGRFDDRYTSTPCLVRDADGGLLVYYSARSRDNTYQDGLGITRRDNSGVYASIGLATLKPIS